MISFNPKKYFNAFCSRWVCPTQYNPLLTKSISGFFVEWKSLCLDFNYAQFLQRNRLWIELNLVQQWRRIAFAKNDYCNRECVYFVQLLLSQKRSQKTCTSWSLQFGWSLKTYFWPNWLHVDILPDIHWPLGYYTRFYKRIIKYALNLLFRAEAWSSVLYN